jgi:hypothetical protein
MGEALLNSYFMVNQYRFFISLPHIYTKPDKNTPVQEKIWGPPCFFLQITVDSGPLTSSPLREIAEAAGHFRYLITLKSLFGKI